MTRIRLAWSLAVVAALLIVLYLLGVVGRPIGVLGFGAALVGWLMARDPRGGAGSPAPGARRWRTLDGDVAPAVTARSPSPAAAPPLQQAAAIAFRREGGRVEICLIRKWTMPWGIPKGRVEPGETLEETALRESLEEAGVRGRLIGSSIGTYEYRKRGRPCVVAVYLLEVHEERSVWRELGYRERKWVTGAEALALLSRHPARSLVERAASMLGADASS